MDMDIRSVDLAEVWEGRNWPLECSFEFCWGGGRKGVCHFIGRSVLFEQRTNSRGVAFLNLASPPVDHVPFGAILQPRLPGVPEGT